jgi:hypothetical protein
MKLPSFSLKSSKETLTSNSGLILFGEFCQKIGLSKEVRQYLPSPGSNRGYSTDKFVLPLVMMLHTGGQHLEDIRAIGKDEGLRRLMGLETLPEAGTVGDWLRRMGSSAAMGGLSKINRRIVEHTLRHVDKKDLTLDIDATGIQAHKYEALYTYKHFKGYMPIVGHIAENGAVVAEEFRAGNVAPATDNLGFVKQCVSQLPKEKRFAFLRADAASYQADIINYCEEKTIRFAIGGVMCRTLSETIQCLPKSSWKRYVDRHGVTMNTEIATVAWSMEKSKQSFSVIVLRTPLDQPDLFIKGRYKYHLVATNRLEEEPQTVLHWYCERGEHSENRIKELKNGFAMERMPCGTQAANAVFFRIGALAYNLFILFKWAVLGEGWLRAQIQTIRLHVYHLPGKIVKSGRKLFLKVPENIYSQMQQIRLNITALSGYT